VKAFLHPAHQGRSAAVAPMIHDLTFRPKDARRTAAAIPGATRTVMEDLGHFPMSGQPAGFRPYIADALQLLTVPAKA
jgi:pimeloyl-ACP methyl ester carboxylesterase